MKREELADLTIFLAVAEERSFTRAAARIGTSQSAISHTVRRLEERLGLRLLTRTTRSVAPTEAGERLLDTLGPALDDIDARLTALSELKAKPSGTVRITTGEHAARTRIYPALKKMLPDYPEMSVELIFDQTLVDIVEGRYDAGVRLGEQVAKDMIAVRIGPELRMIAVAAPDYILAHGAPKAPTDLTHHRCINIRQPTSGGLYAWEFEKGGHELRVRVDGPLILNNIYAVQRAALDGLGIAFIFEDIVAADLKAGRLVNLLDDWCPPFAGYHLYYPSRRQQSPAFRLVLDALRYRG